jgi:hypothetical protein
LRTPTLNGACWAGLAGQLRSVTTDGTGPFTDAHLPALAGCSHVSLGVGAAVTDAGVAAHLSGRVSHLRLDLTRCAGFDGSCLRGCARLVDLRLATHGENSAVVPLVHNALSGCAAGLTSLELEGVDGGDALLTAGGGGGLPALRRATLRRLPALTDAAFAGGTTPALAELEVWDCPRIFGGAGLGPLPSLASLDVKSCGAFTGRALTGGSTPALQWLAVRECPRFAWRHGGGGGGGGRQRTLLAAVAALPALKGAIVAGAPCLTDAWFAHAPALTHVALERCGAVVGGTAVGGRLPALTHLAVADCDGFTGGWLGAAAGGGDAPTCLEALTVSWCDALSLPGALGPAPHPRIQPRTTHQSHQLLCDCDRMIE